MEIKTIQEGISIAAIYVTDTFFIRFNGRLIPFTASTYPCITAQRSPLLIIMIHTKTTLRIGVVCIQTKLHHSRDQNLLILPFQQRFLTVTSKL